MAWGIWSTQADCFSPLSTIVPFDPLSNRTSHHPQSIPILPNPLFRHALAVAMILYAILEWGYALQQFQCVLASLDLCIFPTARLSLCYDVVMDHYHCKRGYRTAGNEGRELAGHEAVVCAAEGKGHEVVEVGLVGWGE